ncbi:hypothetical protein ACN28S_00705 [Cystobacter fuscus]
MPSQLAHTLIAQGLLPQDKAEEALRHQAAYGGALDTTLLERQWLAEPQVLHALGEASGLRPVNLADFEPNADVASFIPPKIADRLCVVPLSLDGSTLHVACGYPVPRKELEEVGFLLGKSLELWVATEVRVREWISVIYRLPLTPRYSAVLGMLDPERMGVAPPLPPRRSPRRPRRPGPKARTPPSPWKWWSGSRARWPPSPSPSSGPSRRLPPRRPRPSAPPQPRHKSRVPLPPRRLRPRPPVSPCG